MPYNPNNTPLSVWTYNKLLRTLNDWFISIHKHPIYIVYQPNKFIGLRTRMNQLFDEYAQCYSLSIMLDKDFDIWIPPKYIEEMSCVEELFQAVEMCLGRKAELKELDKAF